MAPGRRASSLGTGKPTRRRLANSSLGPNISIPYKTYQPNFEGNSVNGPVQGLAAAGGCNSVYSLAIRKSLVRENAKGHAQEAMQTGATGE